MSNSKDLILSNTDEVAIVSESDYELLSEYNWNIKRNNVLGIINNESISLQRFITNAPIGSVVYHINCNILDNRRENLIVS